MMASLTATTSARKRTLLWSIQNISTFEAATVSAGRRQRFRIREYVDRRMQAVFGQEAVGTATVRTVAAAAPPEPPVNTRRIVPRRRVCPLCQKLLSRLGPFFAAGILVWRGSSRDFARQ